MMNPVIGAGFGTCSRRSVDSPEENMHSGSRIAAAIAVSLLIGFVATTSTGCIFAAAKGAEKIHEKAAQDESDEKKHDEK